MKTKFSKFSLIFSILSSFIYGNSELRLGKLDSQSWTEHALLGENKTPYEQSNLIPDFSSVGALLSDNGILGTATLIAPDTIITAAHVLKNRTKDPLPTPSDWKFILYYDFESAPLNFQFQVESFSIHPDWMIRQQKKPPFGDGDRVGVDVAIGKLKSSVFGFKPYRLPTKYNLVVSQKIYLAGFGNLVEGQSGSQNSSNSRRMAGENVLDRIVTEITVEGSVRGTTGGLLAFDFDSPSKNTNTLGKSSGSNDLDYLTAGDSDVNPITFEVSTAEGDSGGPLIAQQNELWRLFGTVSYGSSNSTYGDITVLTRLTNHLDWILEQLPVWPTAKLLNDKGWRESDWLGYFIPFSSGWNYHSQLGWLWSMPKTDDSVWVYCIHLGWLWTTLEIYPFFYSETQKDWLYLNLKESRDLLWSVYHYSNPGWKVYNL